MRKFGEIQIAEFKVEVNYGRSVKQGFEDAGIIDHDGTVEEIIYCYSKKESGSEAKELKEFVHMKLGTATTKDALTQFEKLGLRLPNIWEALSFIENHPTIRFLHLERFHDERRRFRCGYAVTLRPFYANFYSKGRVTSTYTFDEKSFEAEFWNDSTFYLGIKK